MKKKCERGCSSTNHKHTVRHQMHLERPSENQKPTTKEVCVFQRRLLAGLWANNAIHRWRNLLRSGVSICLPTLSKVWDTQMMFIILGNITSFIGRTAVPLALALSQIAHIIVLVGICSPVHSIVMMSMASSLALRLFANTCRRTNR